MLPDLELIKRNIDGERLCHFRDGMIKALSEEYLDMSSPDYLAKVLDMVYSEKKIYIQIYNMINFLSETVYHKELGIGHVNIKNLCNENKDMTFKKSIITFRHIDDDLSYYDAIYTVEQDKLQLKRYDKNNQELDSVEIIKASIRYIELIKNIFQDFRNYVDTCNQRIF